MRMVSEEIVASGSYDFEQIGMRAYIDSIQTQRPLWLSY